jgi:hypothetical protein
LIPDKVGFLKKVENECDLTIIDTRQTEFGVGHKTDLKGRKKIWLLKKIRNGIAHLNIKWENECGKCKDIRLWNEPKRNVKDFEIVFTIEQLRNLAIELSNKYMNET